MRDASKCARCGHTKHRHPNGPCDRTVCRAGPNASRCPAFLPPEARP